MPTPPVPPRDQVSTEHHIKEVAFGFDVVVSIRDMDYKQDVAIHQRTRQEALAWLHLSRVLKSKGVDLAHALATMLPYLSHEILPEDGSGG